MTEIKDQEYALLNEIANDSMVTQANLSHQLGMAVGSVNWYIKRLVKRGLIKVSHLSRTRLKYDLTPEGMSVFTQRALLYARDSLKVYGNLRQKAKGLVQDLKQKKIKEVYIDGQDEMSDILRLTCIEAGIHVEPIPNGVTLKATNQGYQVTFASQPSRVYDNSSSDE